MIKITAAAIAKTMSMIMSIMSGFLCSHSICNLSLQLNPTALGAYIFLLFIV